MDGGGSWSSRWRPERRPTVGCVAAYGGGRRHQNWCQIQVNDGKVVVLVVRSQLQAGDSVKKMAGKKKKKQ